jgi:hypothetical protein
MDTATTKQTVEIDPEKLLASVRVLVSGISRNREDDQHPLPPGPWDPVIRAALERIAAFTPAWTHVGGEVALNPQPLPPRLAFLVSAVQTFAARAALLEEFAGAGSSDAEQRGIIIVSGYVERFADEWCGNGFRLKWPFPQPRPNWFASELDGIDLLLLATQFEQAARQSFSEELRGSLHRAAARFAHAGLERLA